MSAFSVFSFSLYRHTSSPEENEKSITFEWFYILQNERMKFRLPLTREVSFFDLQKKTELAKCNDGS